MCFSYEVTAALNHKKIGKNTQRRTKIRNCKTRKKPEKVWNKQMKIVLNILFSPHNIEKEKTYISKLSSEHESQGILVMIPDNAK